MNEDNVTVSTENGKLISALTTSLRPYKDGCTNDKYTTPTMPVDPNHTDAPSTGLVYFTGSVYFNEVQRPTEVTATNVPSYTDEWQSPPFNSEGWSNVHYIF